MTVNYLSADDLDGDAFVGIRAGNTTTVKPKISPVAGNTLTLTSQGLTVVPPNEAFYPVRLGTNIQISTGVDENRRRQLVVRDGVGILHLDIKATRAITDQHVIATLPTNAPVPRMLVESMLSIGANDVFIWIEGGTRNVMCQGMPANKRCIINLMGFF